jgi:hypothetical protein
MNFTLENYQKIDYKIYTRKIITLKSDVCVDKIFVGVDPGSKHQGISVYANDVITISQIDFREEKNPVQIMLNVIESIKNCILPYKTRFGTCVVEGSSYNEKFGQTSLAEARGAAMLGLHYLGFSILKVPPLRVRKLATGNGKEKCLCFGFPPDATASLLCVLAAINLSENVYLDEEVQLEISQ